MVRGAAKEQAREKAAKKAAAQAPGQSQLKARQAALNYLCPTCRCSLTQYKLLVTHMEAKHPGVAIPPDTGSSK